jgi:predicted TIM-barrel fold metal-dependent hydrolase
MRALVERRTVIQGAGALAAAAAVKVKHSSAQIIQRTNDEPSVTAKLNIIDWHCHHVPARFELTAPQMAPASQRARWDMIARKLRDESLLVKDICDGVLDGRVINIPVNLIADANGVVAHDTIMAINDHMAELAARHSGQLYGLASVDAYDGDRAAREAERAVGDLGLRGLFVDCARGNLLIDAPQARPTLEIASQLGVPVFVHPVAPQPFTKQMAPYGVVGTLFARGTINSASLIALLEGGVFSQLPGLRVVVTAHAIGGLAMAVGLSPQSRTAPAALELLRRHVFIDTQLIHPTLIKASMELLGSDRVMAGSDWPIVDEGPIREPLVHALQRSGLSAGEQKSVASENCLKLLGLV